MFNSNLFPNNGKIPDGTDFNSLLTVGKYFVVSDDKTLTMTNVPEKVSGRLFVLNMLGDEKVLNNPLPVLVDFYSDSCVPCKRLAPVIGTVEDEKAIAWLAEKIAKRYYEIPKDKRNGKCQITVSTSFFVPKPFTPFQWARMYTPGDYLGFAKTVNHEIKDMKNQKSIRYNWHQADETLLEGIFARGDRKVAKAIRLAYENGALFDAWTEYWNYDRWVQAFADAGLDMDFYTLRERDRDEIFPWDFIRIGVTKKFLWKEWERAHAREVTPNCRQKCSGCGAAQYGGGVCTECRE